MIGHQWGGQDISRETSGYEGGAKQGYLERPHSFVAMNDIGLSLPSRGVEEKDEAMRP